MKALEGHLSSHEKKFQNAIDQETQIGIPLLLSLSLERAWQHLYLNEDTLFA